MVELLHWFQTTYPELKYALLSSPHNFDDSDTVLEKIEKNSMENNAVL